jgi:hypothetical protein
MARPAQLPCSVGHAELGKNMKITVTVDDEAEFVRFGDRYSIPARFLALLEPEAGETHPRCEMTIAIENGRAVCEGFCCTRIDGSPPISGTVLRTLPLSTWLREATTAIGNTPDAGRYLEGAGPFRFESPDGAHAPAMTMRTGDGGSHLPFALAGSTAGFQAAIQGPQRVPRRGIPLSEDHFTHVARIYRAATPSGAPTAAVAKQMHVARSTAGRWVMQARKRGFLGAAGGTTGGEAGPI